MIIRAVDSSDDDDGEVATSLSSGGATEVASLSDSTAVKLAWLGASLGLILLLLLDLAAWINQWFPAPDAPPRVTDPFTVISWLLLLWRGHAVSFQPATLLNNLLGQLFVGAWIYSRETALATQRQRPPRRNGTMQLPVSIVRYMPLLLVIAVLCLGHLVSCSYILYALFESHGGNVRIKFWLGRSSIGSRTVPRV